MQATVIKGKPPAISDRIPDFSGIFRPLYEAGILVIRPKPDET
jgi:hypothetical protein